MNCVANLPRAGESYKKTMDYWIYSITSELLHRSGARLTKMQTIDAEIFNAEAEKIAEKRRKYEGQAVEDQWAR